MKITQANPGYMNYYQNMSNSKFHCYLDSLGGKQKLNRKMIIEELSSDIIIDEVAISANPNEVYFLSHLFGTEMLKIPDDWPGKIYTSEFICEILFRNKSLSHSSDLQEDRFKVLQPNVPIKLKIKDRTIKVTMFETGEITNNVMFLFDDESETYLYTGIFTEIGSLYNNEEFMTCVQKGIDNVYIYTTRCKSNSYISAENTVQEIKRIAQNHPDSKIAVIVPTYGYERFLMQLVKEFPHEVRPISKQRRILKKLGCEHFGTAFNPRIFLHPPGIKPELIESNGFLVVYITERKSSETSAFGIFVQEWSPFPSQMDLRALLEIVQPKRIFPIKSVPLETTLSVPCSLRWLKYKEEDDTDSSYTDWDSDSDLDSIETASLSRASIKTTGSQATTAVFQSLNQPASSNASRTESTKSEEIIDDSLKEDSPPKRRSNTDLTVKRTRVIRHRTEIVFEDSDED